METNRHIFCLVFFANKDRPADTQRQNFSCVTREINALNPLIRFNGNVNTINDGRRYRDGSGWGKGRGRGRGRGRGMGKGRRFGRGSESDQYTTLRDVYTQIRQSHDVSSKILTFKTYARTVVNRLRGIDERVFQAKDVRPQKSAPAQEPLDSSLNARRGPSPIIAVVDQTQCIRCSLCVEVCPEQAVSLLDDVITIDTDKCVACGMCVRECASEAISLKERTKPLAR